MPHHRYQRVASIAAIIAFASVLSTSVAVHADHDGEIAQQAAREIQAARDRADAAAQALFDAESRLDTLDIEIADAVARVGELEAEVDAMRSSLSQAALRRYTSGGSEANPLLGSVGDATAHASAVTLASVATDGLMVDVDDYTQRRDELDDARTELERRRSEESAARDEFDRLRADAEEQIVLLQEIESDRVRDAEVQHALERERAAREAREREAREQAEREAREREEREAREEAERSGNGGGGDDTAPPSTGGSGESPPPAPAAGLACPVAGAVGFSNTWGAPRSGGRSHEGVDMIAAAGTPLVAMESGTATFRTNRLGGNVVSLQGESGTRYYYAHLSAWEGSSRSVARGEVIGYVGKTGNTTVNHLHLQVHPGGGRSVNPYPYVRNAC